MDSKFRSNLLSISLIRFWEPFWFLVLCPREGDLETPLSMLRARFRFGFGFAVLGASIKMCLKKGLKKAKLTFY